MQLNLCLIFWKTIKPTTLKTAGVRAAAAILGLLMAAAWPEVAEGQNAYIDHRLVSDLAGVADFTDTNLVNPWGIAFSGTSPFWISDNHSGRSTLYNSTGTPQALVVNIPPPTGGTPPGAPTGIIFNSTTGFTVASNAPARFIFATEDGTIAGWNSGTNAVLKVDNSASGAVYKGLAIGRSGNGTYLYATDFHNGKIDAFDTNYASANLAGSFADPTIPAGFAPFGIENVNGQLFVTYALQDVDAHDDVPGPGNGFVNVFDTAGNLLRRFATSNSLNSPWGIAMAPSAFGAFSKSLLVGNFGDGDINAFDPTTGAWLGSLTNQSGAPFVEDGLWAIKVGNGGSGGDAHTLYYTAGIPGQGALEDHGLFGSLSPVFPSFIGLNDKGVGARLTWAGGVGPFLLQRKANLADPAWVDVLTTSSRDVTLPKQGQAGFSRIVNSAATTVLPFSVLMNGASEIPVIDTLATATGLLSINGTNLTYNIDFSGLSSPATAAHLHGTASPTNSAGVLIPLNGASGTSGTLSGTVPLTDDQLAQIASGLMYVNIHTTNHSGGEIRGQVVPLRIPIVLNGASEVPPVATSATASGILTLIGSVMYYDINYSGLQGPATAAHIHGPADTATSTNVLVALATPSGTSGTLSGSVSLDPTNLTYVLSGLTYINIHSTTNQGGEIRGQILPLQFTANLNGASEVSATASPGSGTGVMSVLNNVLTYNISFSNLLSAATGSHIHGPADTTHNAPILIPFASTPSATSGTITGTAPISNQVLAQMIQGLTYANIHTTNYPGGEIRGQVLPHF
jgi:uncharacterized protein (TIGR03118 family)